MSTQRNTQTHNNKHVYTHGQSNIHVNSKMYKYPSTDPHTCNHNAETETQRPPQKTDTRLVFIFRFVMSLCCSLFLFVFVFSMCSVFSSCHLICCLLFFLPFHSASISTSTSTSINLLFFSLCLRCALRRLVSSSLVSPRLFLSGLSSAIGLSLYMLFSSSRVPGVQPLLPPHLPSSLHENTPP